jgi:acyl-CoA thioester hydrolase
MFHERSFRVRHYECDLYGHVNHANYLRYMQEAAFDASAAVGYSLETYQAMARYWLIRDTDVEYLSPLRFGDTVRVKTWVVDFRRVRSRRAYELYRENDGELVARAQTDWVFLETETNRPATVPPEMVTAFLPAGLPASLPASPPAARPRPIS